MFSKQQTFDQVAAHLLIQGRPSGLNGRCCYRGGRLRCAASVLLPDSVYTPEIEGRSISELLQHLPNHPAVVYLKENHHLPLVAELQRIHDEVPVEQWPSALTELGRYYGLATDVVDRLQHLKPTGHESMQARTTGGGLQGVLYGPPEFQRREEPGSYHVNDAPPIRREPSIGEFESLRRTLLQEVSILFGIGAEVIAVERPPLPAPPDLTEPEPSNQAAKKPHLEKAASPAARLDDASPPRTILRKQGPRPVRKYGRRKSREVLVTS